MKSPEDLADEHWEWLEKALSQCQKGLQRWLPTVEYFYKSAFVHGYKHAKEERKEATNESKPRGDWGG